MPVANTPWVPLNTHINQQLSWSSGQRNTAKAHPLPVVWGRFKVTGVDGISPNTEMLARPCTSLESTTQGF